MSELIPCNEYESRTNSCRSGHMQIHPICRGLTHGCPTCGVASTAPICMRDEVPAHLIREDGMPLGWPIKQVTGEPRQGEQS